MLLLQRLIEVETIERAEFEDAFGYTRGYSKEKTRYRAPGLVFDLHDSSLYNTV
jgi:hypothetical protein